MTPENWIDLRAAGEAVVLVGLASVAGVCLALAIEAVERRVTEGPADPALAWARAVVILVARDRVFRRPGIGLQVEEVSDEEWEITLPVGDSDVALVRVQPGRAEDVLVDWYRSLDGQRSIGGPTP